MARPRLARVLGLVGWTAVGMGLGRPDASADIPPPGSHGVAVTARIDWGPLAPRLARPVAPRDGDPGATLAERAAGDPAWAEAVAAMNGGGASPAPGTATAWVPPIGVRPSDTAPWYSAYAESAKWPDRDISRTGLRRVGPGGEPVAVFGTVEVFVLRHAAPEDAARSHALVGRRGPSLVGEPGVFRSAPLTVPSSAHGGDPTVRVEQDWRVEGVVADALRVAVVEVRAFDAQGRGLGPTPPATPGVSVATPWLAVAAFVLLAAAAWERARRRRKAA